MPFFRPGTELYRRFYGEQTTVDPVQVPGMPTIEEPTGPVVSFPYIDPTGGMPFSPVEEAGQFPDVGGGWGPIIRAVGESLARQGDPQFPDVTGGSSTTAGALACWKPTKTGKLQKRAQVKIVRNPITGAPELVKYCRPKRMNPLNPRALGRAARRLGSFHRIAATVEKQIQHACRSGIGRRRSSPRLPASCAPRRCR